MNVTRVTVAGSAAQSIANVQSAASRLATTQNQLSSGKRISTSSDDPDGTVTALRLRSELSRSSQFDSSAKDALAWLSSVDSAYSHSVSALQSARTLVVQALNSGTSTDTTRSAIAQQLEGLRSTLLTFANTTYDGRPVFGGATAGPVAFDTTGIYAGDGGSVSRAVTAQSTVTVGAVGAEVFGSAAGGPDAFALLAQLADSVRSGTLTSSGLADLDTVLGRVGTAQAAAGVSYQHVQQVQTARATQEAALTSRLDDVERVDLAEMAVKLAAANTAYQAALQTTATVSRLSLLDFLN